MILADTPHASVFIDDEWTDPKPEQSQNYVPRNGERTRMRQTTKLQRLM
jgi:hypothetical protein